MINHIVHKIFLSWFLFTESIFGHCCISKELFSQRSFGKNFFKKMDNLLSHHNFQKICGSIFLFFAPWLNQLAKPSLPNLGQLRHHWHKNEYQVGPAQEAGKVKVLKAQSIRKWKFFKNPNQLDQHFNQFIGTIRNSGICRLEMELLRRKYTKFN